MQPFLLEFVDSTGFRIGMAALGVAAVLGVLGMLAAAISTSRQLRTGWRWWKALDDAERPGVVRRYLKQSVILLATWLAVAGTLVLANQLKQRAAEPALARQRQQAVLREQVIGEYWLPDTVRMAAMRTVQQHDTYPSVPLPPDTLVKLIVRRDGTFRYQTRLPTDATPSGESAWMWQTLTGDANVPGTFGPVFYSHSIPLQSLWTVREHGSFLFFSSYNKDGRSLPFALKRGNEY